jgi:hypothetical protein
MKLQTLFVLIIFLFLFSAADAQQQTKKVLIKGKELSKKATKKVIPKTPDSYRSFDGKGTIYVWLDVNETGEVEKAQMNSPFELLRSYVEDAAKQWKFKPLVVNNKKTAFRGLLILYLNYGGFISETPPGF